MASALDEATKKALALSEEERMGLTLELLSSFEAGRVGLQRLERELLRGLESPKSDWTVADAEAIRHRLRTLHKGS